MTIILGFAGRKRSGKDTAAAVMEGVGYQKLSYAMPIKLMLMTLLSYRGVSDEELERYTDGDLKEEPTALLQGRTPRHAMQTLGTEWGRELIGEDLWSDTLLDHASDLDAVVVSDVRFPNEVAGIQRKGGEVIRITRPDLPPLEADAHPSEAKIGELEVNHDVTNDASSAQEFQQRLALLLLSEGNTQ